MFAVIRSGGKQHRVSENDRIVVERKTARDFVDTLVERDLLGQLRSLADAAPRPVADEEQPERPAAMHVAPASLAQRVPRRQFPATMASLPADDSSRSA